MHKIGVVTAINHEHAVVLLARHSACSQCGGCGHGGGDAESKEMLVEALNEANAVVGDWVHVDLESVQVVRAAFIFYAIPLIALFVGVFAAKAVLDSMGYASQSDLGAAIFGTFLMVIAFVGIRMNEERLQKSGRYLSRVVEICESEKNR